MKFKRSSLIRIFAGQNQLTVAKLAVIPAKAGIQKPDDTANSLWIPAFAGMTEIFFRLALKEKSVIYKIRARTIKHRVTTLMAAILTGAEVLA